MKKFKEVSKYNFARDIIFVTPILCMLIVIFALYLVALPIQLVLRIVERLEYLILVVLKKIEKKYFKKD